jgi:transposase
MTRMQLSQAMDLHLREGVPIREIADLMGVSHMTVWRALGAEIRGGIDV